MKFLVLVLLMAAAPAAPPAELRATFIGNMGVHLTDGRVAMLTDLPYKSGSFGYMEWSKAAVPKGSPPLCVFTHSHDDHFDPGQVPDHCKAVLGPKDVEKAARALALDSKLELVSQIEWEGITIHPIATPHAGLEHYSYLVEWGGARLYFTGDTEDTKALLAAKDLDVAFVSPWLLAAVESKKQRIDARQVVVYHHRLGEIVAEHQDRIVPAQGQVLSLKPQR